MPQIVVCVSNFLPTEINSIKSDQAVLEKLIGVQFPVEAALPAHLQVANLENFYDRFIPEIFNWALYAPLSVLKNHIRETNNHSLLLKAQDSESKGGIGGYLSDHALFCPKEEAFTTVTDLRTAVILLEASGGDTHIQASDHSSNTKKVNQFIWTAKRFFGKTLVYKKSSKKYGGLRPMGIQGLVLFKETLANSETKIPTGLERFEYVLDKNVMVLDDLFYAEQGICLLRKASK